MFFKEKRGRPQQSNVRDRLQRMLTSCNRSYGYALHRAYEIIFENEPTTQRNIFYNLQKGEQIGLWTSERQLLDNKNSWEGKTERRYYTIKKKCSIKDYEKQMIMEVLSVVERILSRDYNRAKRFKELVKDELNELNATKAKEKGFSTKLNETSGYT